MSFREHGPLDRVIDDALESLTSGRPRIGFRGRVMARVTETSALASIRHAPVPAWRLRPFQLVAASVVLACGLAAAIIVPALFPPGVPPRAGTATATSAAPAAAQPGMAAAREANVTAQAQAALVTRPPRINRRAPSRGVDAADAHLAAVGADMAGWVRLDPLPDPAPIVTTLIEIEPIEIEPLGIPHIQLDPIDASGVRQNVDEPRDAGERDSRQPRL